MSDNVLVVSENTIKAGQLDNFKALIREMVDAIQRDEPETLNYEWFIADDGKSVHIYERYADSEAFMVHLGNIGPKYGERSFAYLTVNKLAIYGNQSDTVREVLKDLAPIYMSRYDGVAR